MRVMSDGNYYKTALLSQVALLIKLTRAVKAYFVVDVEYNIAAAILAERTDSENCLPTEYSGHASDTVVDVAAAAVL